MEYTVGVSNMDIELRPLIENRLSAANKRSGQIQIKENHKNYVALDFAGREQLFELADILADIVIENLQIRFIMREIAHDYDFVAEKDQCEILINTLKRLWYHGEKGDLEHLKQDISSRIAVCMLEGQEHVLWLDGVLRFRMRDFVEQWKDTLEDCVDDYLLESEKHEFIKLLRYFVSMRDPILPYVIIRPGEEEYQIFDGNSAKVSVILPGSEHGGTREVSKEDLLLSQLINLAPENINISEIQDEDLKTLLHQVFIGRIRS